MWSGPDIMWSRPDKNLFKKIKSFMMSVVGHGRLGMGMLHAFTFQISEEIFCLLNFVLQGLISITNNLLKCFIFVGLSFS